MPVALSSFACRSGRIGVTWATSETPGPWHDICVTSRTPSLAWLGSPPIPPTVVFLSKRFRLMSYLAPSEFVTKMVDAGESKIFMSTRDTVIRAYMAGAILALAAAFAVSVNVSTGVPIVGAALFPVGFCMLYLFGFDLLTGVFVLCPLALIDKRPGVTLKGVLRNWGLVFCGNVAGAFTGAVFSAVVYTYGFS